MPEDAASSQREVDDERHRKEEADRRAKRKVSDEQRGRDGRSVLTQYTGRRDDLDSGKLFASSALPGRILQRYHLSGFLMMIYCVLARSLTISRVSLLNRTG